MTDSLLFEIDEWIIIIIQFALMLGCIFLGLRFAKTRKEEEVHYESSSIIRTAIYALMGLMLAFTFSMSGARYDSRKKDVGMEANCIETAILRADMYPDSIRSLFREDFKNYLEFRINYFKKHEDLPHMTDVIEISNVYKDRLWKRAIELSKNPNYLAATQQMIPSLNDMFNIAKTRLRDNLYIIPSPILIMLFIFLLITSFLLGYSLVGKGKLDWYLAICFCVASCIVMYFIMDLDRPRTGLITLDGAEENIIVIRKMFE